MIEAVGQLWSQDQGDVQFPDPALETSVFYSALRQLFPSHQIQSAIGIAIDLEIAQTAENLWQSPGLQVIQDDFTSLPFGLNKIETRELTRVRLPKAPVLRTLALKPKQLFLFER